MSTPIENGLRRRLHDQDAELAPLRALFSDIDTLITEGRDIEIHRRWGLVKEAAWKVRKFYKKDASRDEYWKGDR